MKTYTVTFTPLPYLAVSNLDAETRRVNESYPEEEYAGGRVHRIGTNLRHLMRGELFTIEGKKIFAFGGGESIEKEDRVKAGKWWEREMPTLEEM